MSKFQVLVAKLAAGLLCLAPVAAGAAINCSITSVSSITEAYSNAFGVDSVTTGAYTIFCTRLSTDANTFAWQLGADNGQNAAGAQNRAANGGNRINYETYRINGGGFPNGNRWQDAAATRFTGTINFGSSLNASTTGTFYLRTATGQNPAAGVYTDLVTVTLRNSAGTSIGTTTFNVAITVAAACQITAPPGNLNFTYTSLQAAAASASTTFALRCTNGHAYSMALDSTSNSLLGLTYTLGLSSSNATGNGASQTFTINGSIAASQAGTCSTGTCTGTQTRTLTVTY
jgi:spore coat protein U-like protein